MTRPVDVLAVLDEARDWLYRSSESLGDDARAESVKQARSAVAELINRAEYLCRTGEGMLMFRAALANVGGAP